MSKVIILSFIVLLVCLFLKMSVFAAMLTASAVYFFVGGQVTPYILDQRMISGVESIPLMAVPFFIGAGVFMNYSGITRRIMDFCEVLTGKLPGGLAQVNILLSTIMGGLSGSSLADAAMEAKMLVPEMEKRGLPKDFSSVITAFSAVITPLIPPGIAMILYGSIAQISIGKLFIAGIGPGLLTCIAMMVLTGVISKKRKYRTLDEKFTVSRLGKAFKPAAASLCLPIIIIGGIRIGVFTATEAGAIACLYALILGLSYKELNIKTFLSGVRETVETTAAVLIIVGAASTFAWILTREQIPQYLANLMVTSIGSKYLYLLIVNLFLLVVGMFIEGNAALIVLVPLLHPIALEFNIDPIQFATIFNFNMAIGSITPPLGTLMFTTIGVTGCSMKQFLKESIPYFILFFAILLAISYVPFFTLGLVNLIY
ncbi:MAG: TRAP transporter large permease [Ruminococcus sp.]|nr:TRAP transporter large permease [Ruminococcus sp.]